MAREAVTLSEYYDGKRGALVRKPSRAAIRDKYGSRRIDASAPQSEKDTTPSGREARLRQSGWDNEAEIKQRLGDEFQANFGQKLRYSPTNTPTALGGAASDFKDKMPNAAAGFTAANPVTGGAVPIDPGYQAPQAPVKVPGAFGAGASAFPSTPGFTPVPDNMEVTPLSFNLSAPSPLNASTLSQYASPTGKPYTPPWKMQQKPPGGFMASMLNGASKYLNTPSMYGYGDVSALKDLPPQPAPLEYGVDRLKPYDEVTRIVKDMESLNRMRAREFKR